MKLTFEQCYHGDVSRQVPPDSIRTGAETQVQYLLPGREHMLYTTNGREFYRGALRSSEGWRITYTPQSN